MVDKDEGQYVRTPSTSTDGAQIPTYDELFRMIRAAGPSNPAKARAVDSALTGARVFIRKLNDERNATNLQQRSSSLIGSDPDAAGPSASQQIIRVVGHLLAKTPQWVRQDLISADAAVRLRAEDTLAAMIAALLGEQVEL